MTGRTNSVRKLRTVHGKVDKLVAGQEYGQEQSQAAGAEIKNFETLKDADIIYRIGKILGTESLLNGYIVGAKGKHAPGDFFNRADIGMIRHDGRMWHRRHYRFVRILHKSYAAVFRDSPESSGAVAITTT